ncbi:hypothetical protein TREPR_1087 [Treponema primitia ZAS-2]|uniref:Basic membrane protein n=1 Tax=Treponema primitia (strain ATCC BAA-887 / DSM 12427 / ZAS-2) TaxID=545694 RepID=F5YHB7_TREPZ|nr:hypothetical protein [Treponema primitia]AEF83983.1 hypothetical protein TREPR_1087 [Treponema primitia ZAS-2]
MGFKGLIKGLVIAVLALVVVLGLGTGMFFLRSPVLMVIGDEFTGLYGLKRTRVAQIESSLKLFRRVKIVRIVDGSAPDMVAFAVEAAASKPYAALFAYSYYQGAGRYAEQFPEVPVGVLGGIKRPDTASERLVFVETDREGDFYRAGLCAARIALSEQPEGGGNSGSGGRILFITGDLITRAHRESFSRGLKDQGYDEMPRFADAGGNFTGLSGISCAVMTAPAEFYLDKDLTIPVILFSWLDPAATAREVKVIFDDSPWALGVETVKMLVRGETVPLPSKILALKDRFANTRVWRDIKKTALAKDIH